jgi:two-component system, OmpR family, phosphate regulon sensor histidine kinase PhoR
LKLGIRSKLFLTSLTLFGLAFTLSGLILLHSLNKQLNQRLEVELGRHANAARVVFENSLSTTDMAAADALADKLGQATRTRITLIQADGVVIGDSELTVPQLEKLEKHLDRKEILSAFKSGSGSSLRFSTTVERELLYVAVRTRLGDETIVVRVSRPTSIISEATSQLRGLLLTAGLVGLAFALALTLIFTHQLVRAVRRLVDYARQMVDGNRNHRIEVSSSDEFGWLAGSLNHLSEQIEQQLATIRTERDQFSAVLEGMGEAVLSLDDEGRITQINRAGIMLLGLHGAPIGQRLLDTVRSPLLRKLINQTEHKDKTIELDLSTPKPRRLLAHTTRPSGGGVVVVLLDVTELRRLETMRRDFVANVSHELRTPISIILAGAETLQDGAIDDPDTAGRFLNSIMKNAGRLSNLISDLLDLSRMEDDKYGFEITRLSTEKSLKRTAAALESAALEKNISVTLDTSCKADFKADAKAIDQVLFNYLDNAIKYTPKGGKVVMQATQKDHEVLIEVIDNGPGIAKDHRSRLFERFYRVDKGRSREMGGTGLGLAIAKHLVTAMNGKVGMRQAKGDGSVFWVSLPGASSKD